MKSHIYGYFLLFLAGLNLMISVPANAQYLPDQTQFYSPSSAQRAFDSLVAARIPVLAVPSDALSQTLPDSLDNSHYIWFPGILNQHSYYACQQYCGTAYTFAYEMNRLRDENGKIPEHKYPPHYAWNFLNQGEQYFGVNFLHSFHAMMEQGHMTNADYGADTGQFEKGWITGYDKYYRAMKNRIRNVYAIPINSTEGILTMKQYLYDHLDGSPTGGIACFTAASPSGLGTFLPENSPEAGKYVMTTWLPYPTHGMTIVGYHDSIRYDLNEDGQYTNDIDITGDGIVDARDWEIGGFRLANSYGGWWADVGFFYVLYSAMASNFGEGGVWNNSAYIVEPDPDYSPLLTVKVDLDHNQRDQLNIMAGVSLDLDADYPEHLIDPLFFTNQGGPYYMQGFDTLPELKNLEFGLDVTPLLSYIEPGQPARFFLIVEERDPSNTGQGILNEASFMLYGATPANFPCSGSGVEIRHNGTTIISASGTVTCDPPAILNEELPPFPLSGIYSEQFHALGGEAPYVWDLYLPYQEMNGGSAYEPFDGNQLTPQSPAKPFVSVPIPFSFPFFGKSYDTLTVNRYGMVQFSREDLPYPYLCSETDMLNYIPAIVPSFSWDYVIRQSDGDGIWMSSSPDSVRIRWKLSLHGEEPQTNIEFGITLFPNGTFSFYYGPANLGENNPITWHGVSSGDKYNTVAAPIFDQASAAGSSSTWIRPELPESVSLSTNGLLSVTGADSSKIYDIPIRVTDMQQISSFRHFQLSSGLLIHHALTSNSGYLQHNEPASLDIQITNISPNPMGNVSVTFFCETDGLLITDSLVSAGNIAAGQSLDLPEAFSIKLITALPDQTSLPCRVVATSEGRSWEHSFCLEVAAVDLLVTGMNVEDGVNELLDAGETAELVFTLTNFGTLPADELTVDLSSTDEYVEILSSPTVPIGTIGQKGMRDARFTVKAARNTPPGHLADLELLITNGSSIEILHPCSLQMGTRPVALINLTASTTSVPLMAHLMDSLGVGYDLYTTIPENLKIYTCAFVILGTSYPGSYALSTEETIQLINYLNHGGNIYLESYASWYYGTAQMLEDMFKFTTERVSVYYFNDMEGVDGTLTEGMDFIYLGSSPYAIFEVIPKGEGFPLMMNKGNPARSLEFGYDGEDYKTIGTFKEFGQLIDGNPPSGKAILFRKYLEFLEVNIDGPFPFFHADTTHLCQWHTVQFTDDSFDNISSWQWEFPGGTPSSSEEQHPVVTYHVPGVFDVILTVSDGINSWSMHKSRYIHINACVGMEEPPAASAEIRIYPNPATNKANIRFPENPGGSVAVDILDMRGSVVSRTLISSPAGKILFPLDISSLAAGIYIVRATGEKTIYSAKLVIY